ncbi:hypothetical protein Agub_g11163, partial [Astrephomene gubernaculifera]
VDTQNTHGTGCTLASAIAAELARGSALLAAVRSARAALQRALRASTGLRLGAGVQRPFDHQHMRREAGGRQLGEGQRAEGELAATSPPPSASVAAVPPVVASRVDREALRRQLRLYAVTDPHCNQRSGRSLLQAVTQAVRGGASIVQLREKELEGGDFLRQAAEALVVCRQYGVPLVINDRVDVALAVGADGVHVGQSDLPAAAVRALLGPGRILGVSVKTAQQAAAAAAAGADYLGAGAVRPTGTKATGVIG